MNVFIMNPYNWNVDILEKGKEDWDLLSMVMSTIA